jgi:DNA oxidative demethylase
MTPRRPRPTRRPAGRPGVHVVRGFVTERERDETLGWLAGLHPLWEQRFSTVRPLPPGETQRWLQRPVYWLGNWQFACLGYYHPPHVEDRCVRAEPFPDVLARWVQRIEALARRSFPASWIPDGWAMDTCLVNFYGNRLGTDGKAEDRARVGAHRDFEPGPVASVSLGARALFQFTTARGDLVEQMWLEDGELQIFAGPNHKDRLFHRVQRVERTRAPPLPPAIDGFATRRVNFTFRHVPPAHVQELAELSPASRADVLGSVQQLAAHSPHWAAALARAG